MKIIPSERIKVGGEYKPAGKVCDVPEDVGKALVEDGSAEKVAGRPSSAGGSQSQSVSKPPTAAELVAEIAGLENVERLQELAEDARKTVSEAACARLNELESEEEESDDDEGGDGSDEAGTGAGQ